MSTTKRAVLAAGLAVVAIVALAGFTYGRPMGPGHHASPEKIYKFVTFKVNDALDDLKASDGQRAQVNAVKDQLFSEAKGLFAGRKEMHEQLVAQWNSERPDAKQVHALIDQRIEEMRTFAHSAADGALKIHDVLTPEQRAQLAQDVAAHHGP